MRSRVLFVVALAVACVCGAMIASAKTPSAPPTDAQAYTEASVLADQAAAHRDNLAKRTTTTATATTTTTVAPTTTTTTTAPSTTTTTVPEAPSGTRCDGTTDDQAALQAAFTAGGTVTIPSGRVCAHSDVLNFSGAGRLTGAGTLLALNEATSSVWITGAGVTVDGLTIKAKATTKRWDAYEQMGLRVHGPGAVVRGVTVDGSAAAGIFADGADHYLIEDVTVQNTRADCIHNTEAATFGQITRPVVRNCGDDGVAVVSYAGQAPCHDITIDSPTLVGQSWGRAFSVVGGDRITYRNVKATGSAGAAVYIANEGNTLSTSNVQVLGGVLDQSNLNTTIGHGAVVIYNGKAGGTITNVTVSDLTITNTRQGAPRQVSLISDVGASDIRFDRLDIRSPGPSSLWYTDAPDDSYVRTAWTLDGVPVSGT